MTHRLICHPATPAPDGLTLNADAVRIGTGKLQLTYCLQGPVHLIKLAVPETPERRDELWKSSCFEMFAREDGIPGYREYNFAPSGCWAHYAFTDYRTGMDAPTFANAPEIELVRGQGAVTLIAVLPIPDAPMRLALTAVIETEQGDKSYWSLAHSDGPPDFHHGDCFVLQLPATDCP